MVAVVPLQTGNFLDEQKAKGYIWDHLSDWKLCGLCHSNPRISSWRTATTHCQASRIPFNVSAMHTTPCCRTLEKLMYVVHKFEAPFGRLLNFTENFQPVATWPSELTFLEEPLFSILAVLLFLTSPSCELQVYCWDSTSNTESPCKHGP